MIVAKMKFRKKLLYISLTKVLEDSYNLSCYHEKNKRISEATFTYLIDGKFPSSIYIDSISTKEGYRRKGYASILVNFIKSLATTTNLTVTLYSYEEALGFWRKLGFKKVKPSVNDLIWKPNKA